MALAAVRALEEGSAGGNESEASGGRATGHGPEARNVVANARLSVRRCSSVSIREPYAV
jgi:hypothetical protein